LIAAAIGYEAVTRLFAPVAINFEQATWLAVAGLSASIL
jgi:Co/Zn/Cd efflux system component